MKAHNLERIKQAARSHAPREACGLIVSKGGAEVVIHCRNISENGKKNFILHPDDYLSATGKGEIIAVWHTHPVTTSAPSEADRTACNRTALPWYIYSTVDDTMTTLYPDGTSTALLGRSFCWGVHDCWTLVADYYKQTLGITFPDIPQYEERFWQRGKNYYIDWRDKCGLHLVTGPAREHDILLMQIHSQVPNHGAILLGNGMILHHLQNRLSCRDVYGGYWREITCGILRHGSML